MSFFFRGLHQVFGISRGAWNSKMLFRWQLSCPLLLNRGGAERRVETSTGGGGGGGGGGTDTAEKKLRNLKKVSLVEPWDHPCTEFAAFFIET